MKKLSVIAFLAALGLLVAGCGGGGSSSSSSVASSGQSGGNTQTSSEDVTVQTGSSGFTTETKFIDPETGKVVSRISEITSSATGDTPPRAPSFVTTRGTAESVSTN